MVSNILGSDEATESIEVFEQFEAQDSPPAPPNQPNSVARFGILPVIMVLLKPLKPLALNLRAGIHNTLIWLCQGEPGSTGAERRGSQAGATGGPNRGRAPNETIYFMDLFDPNLGKPWTVSRVTAARC
ncbi:hypothetical protein BG000_008369 [Podila horticola]|nr:hypothetical protein BG000_008369 [Podila horticola]